MKVYFGGYRGKYHRTVAAESKEEARELLKLNEYLFDRFYMETTWPQAIEVAMKKPRTVFVRPWGNNDPNGWVEVGEIEPAN